MIREVLKPVKAWHAEGLALHTNRPSRRVHTPQIWKIMQKRSGLPIFPIRWTFTIISNWYPKQKNKKKIPFIVLSIAPRPVLYSKGTTCSKKIANVLSLALAPKDNHWPTTHVQGLKRSGIGNAPEQSSQNCNTGGDNRELKVATQSSYHKASPTYINSSVANGVHCSNFFWDPNFPWKAFLVHSPDPSEQKYLTND